MLEFNTVGELIGPWCHLWPMDEGRLSEPPMLRLWQELQEMNPDFDKRGSKKSILPSSTMFSFLGLAASIGWMGSSAAAAMAGGAAMVPTDSSDMINARIIIGNLLKNAAVVAQPITPNELNNGQVYLRPGTRTRYRLSYVAMELAVEKKEVRPGTDKHETWDSLLIESPEVPA